LGTPRPHTLPAHPAPTHPYHTPHPDGPRSAARTHAEHQPRSTGDNLLSALCHSHFARCSLFSALCSFLPAPSSLHPTAGTFAQTTDGHLHAPLTSPSTSPSPSLPAPPSISISLSRSLSVRDQYTIPKAQNLPNRPPSRLQNFTRPNKPVPTADRRVANASSGAVMAVSLHYP
jgi:hypothetical protein